MALDFEEKKMLEETSRITRENNEMLRIIRRGQKWARAWRITYMVILVGIALGAFYFLQPYIEFIQEIYTNAQETLQNIGDLFQQPQE